MAAETKKPVPQIVIGSIQDLVIRKSPAIERMNIPIPKTKNIPART